MSTPKKHLISDESRFLLAEQTLLQITGLLNDVKTEFRDFKTEVRGEFKNLKSDKEIEKKELQFEFNKIWSEIKESRQEVNANFKWTMGVIITLFSGLYATALGGMVLRLCRWI